MSKNRVIEHEPGVTTTFEEGTWKMALGGLLVVGAIVVAFIGLRMYLISVYARVGTESSVDLTLLMATAGICGGTIALAVGGVAIAGLWRLVQRLPVAQHPQQQTGWSIERPRPALPDRSGFSTNVFESPAPLGHGVLQFRDRKAAPARVPIHSILDALDMPLLRQEGFAHDNNHYTRIRRYLIEGGVVDQAGVFDEAAREKAQKFWRGQ